MNGKSFFQETCATQLLYQFRFSESFSPLPSPQYPFFNPIFHLPPLPPFLLSLPLPHSVSPSTVLMVHNPLDFNCLLLSIWGGNCKKYRRLTGIAISFHRRKEKRRGGELERGWGFDNILTWAFSVGLPRCSCEWRSAASWLWPVHLTSDNETTPEEKRRGQILLKKNW